MFVVVHILIYIRVETPIQQIAKEIKRRKDLSVKKVCTNASVNTQTYYNALKSGNIKESTLMKLQKAIDKKLVLIDIDL
ncbi:MAG: hypothetical protein GY793_01860 [Proteobacteria bacterium]|nr:hypothetical protein [Pseudomonadota bacterium]